MIKRYNLTDGWGGVFIREAHEGHWVTHDDHAAEVERLRAENERLRADCDERRADAIYSAAFVSAVEHLADSYATEGHGAEKLFRDALKAAEVTVEAWRAAQKGGSDG